MLEKIGRPGFETVSTPDAEVLRRLAELSARVPDPIIYEIGVGIGATTQAIAEMLDGIGQIVLFSREKDVSEVAHDLQKRGFGNIDARWGSPGQTYSGYHFELARGFAENALPRFDLAYIDGGHVFHLDAPATAVLKELCRPGGYMLFDDWTWSLEQSPTLNPQVRPQTALDYDSAQIKTCQVQLVCKVLMDTDTRFGFEGIHSNTAVYRRFDP